MVVRIPAPAPADSGAQDPQDTGADTVHPLDALADVTRQADDALPPGAAQAQAQAAALEAQQNVRAIVGALKGVRKLAEPKFRWWRDFHDTWADDTLQGIAEALEAVRLHMGWGVEELMGRFGPWIALAMAAGMPAYATWEAIQARRELLHLQQRQRQQAPEPTPAPAP